MGNKGDDPDAGVEKEQAASTTKWAKYRELLYAYFLCSRFNF